MGEIAEMMLGGTLCEGCGEFLNEDAPGFPGLCDSCAEDRRAMGHEVRDTELGFYQDCGPLSKPVRKKGCNLCPRQFKTKAALEQHKREKHQAGND